jgi:serine/threonine protein kinase
MQVPATADQFLDLARKSGLLEPQHLESYLEGRRAVGDSPAAPKALAAAMVRDGLLTRFQAAHLLQGKWRNFILSGKYKVLGPLGSGGMAHVFLCEHLVMRRRVAVKVLPTRPGDPHALERFRREARAVAQLNHPNIVGGHDIDRDGALHFLVMEYIDGSNFQTILKERGPMDPVRAAHYISQAARGLQHAHEAGLVHRDVKPGNLLLDRGGTVKILDLGLARFFRDESDDLSRKDVEGPMGTSDYMAPEQALDSHAVDIRADIYSLGATFYALLAGQSPFHGRTVAQKLMGHQFGRPTPIRELRPNVPEGMAAVLERMMAKDPAERYQTPLEVAQALSPWTRTPIPPPPEAEMPKLFAPARDRGRTAAAPDSPASLYGSDSRPEPWPGPPGDSSPPNSQAPTRPLSDIRGPTHATPTPGAHARPQAAVPPQPPPPPGDSPETGRRRRPVVLATAAVLLLGAAAAGLAVYLQTRARAPTPSGGPADGQPAAKADSPARLRLLVPAYFYPAGKGLEQWERVIESPAAGVTVAVVNADSGPGKAADPNYGKVLERARRRGVTVIGYVSTKYAARPLPEVKEDVDRWVHYYPGIQGIFFDEQSSGPDQVHYYATLYEHVHKTRGLSLVVTNPGTICAEEYFARPAADVVCVVEAAKGFSAYIGPAWADRYPPERFAALLCETDPAARMKKNVLEMRVQRIGYCYITDAKLPNPWDRLPHYWDEEVEAVQQVDGR